MPIENQVAVLYAAVNGYLDDVPVQEVKEWENKFHNYLKHQPILKEIKEKKELTAEVEEGLKKAIVEFKKM